MPAYYNENDPFAAEWLRNLINDYLIAPGDVDERDIKDVTPDDLKDYDQCHFFAGIGGWSLALRIAGVPDDAPVWTGSCPCQPFSAAGHQKGVDDDRHLWPYWRWLVDQCRPPAIFGEQVASPLGRGWLTGVRTDLEAMGYGVGAADLGAASIGAPHIRQRLYWVADGQRTRLEGYAGDGDNRYEPGRIDPITVGSTPPSCVYGWVDSVAIQCADGKYRRVPANEEGQPEPSLFPLADAGTIRNRVGLLRGSGNAIVPALAATFIGAADIAVGEWK